MGARDKKGQEVRGDHAMRVVLVVFGLLLLHMSVYCKVISPAKQDVPSHQPKLAPSVVALAGAETSIKQEEEFVKPAADVPGSYGKILRTCMNTCGGLCRQLCHKFKHIKVCNGCIRGCNKRCELKEEILLESDPEKLALEFSRTLPYGVPPKVGKAH